jgi:GAF domain-containing protein
MRQESRPRQASDPEGFTPYLEALTKISRAITSDSYLEDILKLVVTVTAQVMNSKIVSLLLLDERQDRLVIRATQSVSEEYNEKPPLKLGEGIAGRAAQTNQPLVVADVSQEEEYKYKNIAEKEGLKSLLCVPLAVKGKVIGVLNCYTSVPHHFTPTEIDVLTNVANQAAVAIENTELMVKARVIQEELETRKLVERAKDILMGKLAIKGEEAYRRIQRQSMNSRKSMRTVAEAIILSSQLER